MHAHGERWIRCNSSFTASPANAASWSFRMNVSPLHSRWRVTQAGRFVEQREVLAIARPQLLQLGLGASKQLPGRGCLCHCACGRRCRWHDPAQKTAHGCGSAPAAEAGGRAKSCMHQAPVASLRLVLQAKCMHYASVYDPWGGGGALRTTKAAFWLNFDHPDCSGGWAGSQQEAGTHIRMARTDLVM